MVQEVLGRRRIVIAERNPDAGRSTDVMPVDHDRLGDDLQQTVGDGERLEFHARPLEQEDELVADQPSGEVARAHRVPQAI